MAPSCVHGAAHVIRLRWRGRQHPTQDSSVKKTIWRRCSSETENSSQLLLLGISLKGNLMRTDDVLAKLFRCRRDVAPSCVHGVGLPYSNVVGEQMRKVELRVKAALGAVFPSEARSSMEP